MFVNLHVHDAYGSLLDSILLPEQIAKYAKDNGQPAIALTNHGKMSSFVWFERECRKQGIVPIHGNEVYEVDDMALKQDTKDNKQPRYHLVLLAKNEKGLRNLFKITTSACIDGFYTKPRIDLDYIYRKSLGEGIICLTACQAGRLSRLLVNGEKDKALVFYNKLDDIFDYVACEIQSHKTEDQINANNFIYQFAAEHNFPFVITTDAHMLSSEDQAAHSIFVAIGEGREVGESYTDCYLQTEQDVFDTLGENFPKDVIEKGINEAVAIYKMIEPFEVDTSGTPHMPLVSIADGFQSNEEYLRYLVYKGLEDRKGVYTDDDYQEHIDRIETELPVLFELKYTDYFIILYMLVNEARRRGIPLGPGRGSACGCLCAYFLDITQLDSIIWDLDFSRFANLGRRSMADVDLDISKRRRSEIITIAEELFGKENVCGIATFNSLSTKVAIRDIGKVLNDDKNSPYYNQIPYSLRNEVCNAIPTIKTLDDLGEEVEKEVVLKDVLFKNTKLKEAYNDYPLWFKYVMRLEGLPKSQGRHAAGTLITPEPVTEYCPLCLDKEGMQMCHLEMHQAMDDLGLIKIDFLGLKTLDVIDDSLRLSELSWDIVNTARLNFNDQDVYDSVYKTGNTIGIFQMESLEARRMCMEAAVDNIEDVIVVNAANRPGTKDSFPGYCENKLHPENITVVHPVLNKIFSRSRSVLLYQEQALGLFRYAGFPEDEVDNARRAIGKKKADVMISLKEKFSLGLESKGWSKEQINNVWGLMEKQAEYSFNACVDGKTKIKRAGDSASRFIPTVEEMFRIMHDKQYAKDTGHIELHSKYKNCGYGNALSMYEDGRVRKNRIKNISYSGEKDIYEVITKSGSKICCTMNHKFPTPDGKKQLNDLFIGDNLYVLGKYEKNRGDYNLTDGNYELNYPCKGESGFQKKENGASAVFECVKEEKKSSRASCEVCGREYGNKRFELHHKDFDRKNNQKDNFQWCCASCHKKLHYAHGDRAKVYEKGIPTMLDEIVSIKHIGTDSVYDIEMEAPAHNFISESGLITSNSHAAAYSVLSYITAYLKTHYPLQFMTACLINDSDNMSKVSLFINECRRMGILVRPPHINKSKREFTPIPDKNQILYGFKAIKGIGDAVVDSILDAQPYDGLNDFIDRSCANRGAIISLAKAGAFPTKDRKGLLIKYADEQFDASYHEKQFIELKSLPKLTELYDVWGVDAKVIKDKDTRLRLYNEARLKKWNAEKQDRLVQKEIKRNEYLYGFQEQYLSDEFLWEFETLGMFITKDPLVEASRYISASWDDVESGRDAVVLSVIMSVQKKKDKNGNVYCYLHLYTPSGVIEATCWNSVYVKHTKLISKGTCIAILGRKDNSQLIVKDIKLYTDWLKDRNIWKEVYCV